MLAMRASRSTKLAIHFSVLLAVMGLPLKHAFLRLPKYLQMGAASQSLDFSGNLGSSIFGNSILGNMISSSICIG